MEEIATASVIVSRYGRVCIEWHQATLDPVLAQLRQERQAREGRDNGTGSLISQAEQIKRETENEISHARAPT
jgi:hypothetical protein